MQRDREAEGEQAREGWGDGMRVRSTGRVFRKKTEQGKDWVGQIQRQGIQIEAVKQAETVKRLPPAAGLLSASPTAVYTVTVGF